jgi:uncharacterized protein (TIGR00369 family)
MDLEIDRHCFVCGPENASGLQARFQCSEGRAEGRCLPRTEHQGYTGVSHGGVLAALLDEAMVYAAATLGHWAATVELSIRYSQPALTGAPVTVRAEVLRHRRTLVECRAEVRGEDGAVLASATGKLLQGRPVHPHEAAELEIRRGEQNGRG